MGEKLPPLEYLTGLIDEKNFATVDCLTSFVRMGGSNAAIDVETRTSENCDAKSDLLEGRPAVPAKTDRHPRYCRDAQKQTSYYYNHFSGKLVGGYENRVIAQPVKGRRITTSKTL